MNNHDARRFAIEVARLAAGMQVDQVVVLDLRGLSGIADYFVIGTGTSDRQMHAVLDRIEQLAEQWGRRPLGIADPRDASWIVADYVDVIVHLFDAEHRAYYDLDGLWGDAPRAPWNADQAEPAASAEPADEADRAC